MKNNQEFPKITLKAARVNKGYTQKTAAKRLGINCSTLQKYESGEAIPKWNVVEKISELYGIHSDYIFFASNIALSGKDSRAG